MTRRSEDRLFERFRRTADPRALSELYDRTAAELFRVALHLTRSPADAEDLVQTTFVAAIENAASFDPARPVRPWLLGILANHAKRAWRARDLREHKTRNGPTLRQAAGDPIEQAEAAEFVAAVDDAIEGLPEPYRPVLRLHLAYSMTAAEIAHALGRPPGTVRTQIVRGLDRLRKRLPAGFALSAFALLRPARGLAAVRHAVLAKAPAYAAAAAGPSLAAGLAGGLVLMKNKSLLVTGLVAVLALAVIWTGPGFRTEGAGAPTGETGGALVGPPLPAERPAMAPEDPASGRVPQPGAAASKNTASLLLELRFAEDGSAAAHVGITLRPDGQDAFLGERRGSSDAQGRLLFEALRPGRIAIRTDRSVTRRLQLEAGERTHARLELPRGIDVDGIVVDEGGQAVPAASVWVSGGPGKFRYQGQVVARTDAGGRFRLRGLPDIAFLAARAPGHGPSCRSKLPPPPQGGGSVEVRLVLAGLGARVRGSVLRLDGSPVPAARISIGGFLGMEGPACAKGMSPPPVQARSDAAGEFAIDGLLPGRHPVLVRARGAGPWFEYVDFRCGEETSVSIHLQDGAALTGRVRDAQGRPVAAARILAYAYSNFWHASATSSAEGLFRLEGLSRDRILASVEKDGFRKLRVRLLPASTDVVTWNPELAPVRSLAGRVVDERDRPLRGVWVVLAGGTHRRTTKETDTGGRFVFSDLEDRDYRLFYRIPPPRSRGTPWSVGPLVPCDRLGPQRPGPEEVVVRVPAKRPPGASVLGQILGPAGQPAAGARVQIHQLGPAGTPLCQFPARKPSDVTGFFRAGPLPAGRYALVIRDAARARPRLRIPAIDLAAGEERFLGRLAFPPAGRVEITAGLLGIPPETPPSLEIHSLSDQQTTFARLTKGRTLVPLAAGPYRMALFGRGFVWIDERFEVRTAKTTRIHLRLRPGVQRQLVFPVPQPPDWTHVDHFRVDLRSDDGSVHIEHEYRRNDYWPFSFWPSLAPGRYRIRVFPDHGPSLTGSFVVEDLLRRLQPIRIRLQ